MPAPEPIWISLRGAKPPSKRTLDATIPLGLLAGSDARLGIAVVSAVVLGAGTALVYPTLIAAISDAVSPVARAPMVGVYRFWRDMGYVAGGLIAGVAADAIDYSGAIAIVAGLSAASGLWVAFDLPAARRAGPPWTRSEIT